MNEQTITDTFRKLYKARQDLFTANERTLACRHELEEERAARIMSGEIAGRNEAERDARARELLAPLYTLLQNAEKEERQARLAYDLARLEVDRHDYLLRFLSLPR